MFLANTVKNGKLGINALAKAAQTFGLKKGGVRHLWRVHKSAIVSPGKFKLVLKHKKGAGRPRKTKLSELQQKVKAVPFIYRQTLRSLSAQVGIPTTTLHVFFLKKYH